MEKLLLLTALFTVITLQSFTQESTQSVKWEYCIMTMGGNSATLDIGDGDRIARDKRIRDEQGSPIRFDSAVQVLNYLGERGWELIMVSTSRSGTISHTEYLLKRVKPNE